MRKEILQGLEVNEFSDTAVLHLYSVQLGDLDQKWRNVKTEFEVQNNNIALLLQRVAGASILTRDLTDEVNFRIRNVKRGMLHKTDPFIWEPFTAQEGDIATLFAKSSRFSWRMFVYYVSDRWSFILVLLLIAASFYALVRKGLVYLGNQHQPALLEPVKYLSRNGVLCAALLAFTIIPFLSFSPPAVYIELSWFAMLLVASRLAWVDWSRAYHKYWRGVVLLFFLLGFDNLITRITPGERWFILFISGSAVYLGVKLIQEVKREPLRYPSFQKEVVLLFILANTASLLLNIFGRFTLAKVISNSAVIGLAHALSFFLLVEIMVEALYLALEGNDRKRLSVYFQFSALKIRFRKVLVFIGVCLWLLAFLWSLNLLDSTIDAITDILQKERMIGTMEFTLGSIAIFLLVFWCSFSISNLLRFLFGGNAGNQISGAGKNKMGSRNTTRQTGHHYWSIGSRYWFWPAKYCE